MGATEDILIRLRGDESNFASAVQRAGVSVEGLDTEFVKVSQRVSLNVDAMSNKIAQFREKMDAANNRAGAARDFQATGSQQYDEQLAAVKRLRTEVLGTNQDIIASQQRLASAQQVARDAELQQSAAMQVALQAGERLTLVDNEQTNAERILSEVSERRVLAQREAAALETQYAEMVRSGTASKQQLTTVETQWIAKLREAETLERQEFDLSKQVATLAHEQITLSQQYAAAEQQEVMANRAAVAAQQEEAHATQALDLAMRGERATMTALQRAKQDLTIARRDASRAQTAEASAMRQEEAEAGKLDALNLRREAIERRLLQLQRDKKTGQVQYQNQQQALADVEAKIVTQEERLQLAQEKSIQASNTLTTAKQAEIAAERAYYDENQRTQSAVEKLNSEQTKARELKDQLARSASDLTRAEREASTYEEKLTTAMDQSATVTVKLSRAFEQVGQAGTSAAKQVAEGFLGIQTHIGGIAMKLQGAQIGLAGFGQAMQQASSQGVDFLKAAIMDTAAFDQKLVTLSKVVGDSTPQMMDQIRQVVLQVGQDTVYTSGEILDVTNDLVRSGLSAQEVLQGASNQVAILGEATGASLKDSTQAVILAQNIFRGQQIDIATAVDTTTKAVSSSNISVHDFNESMQAAGATAASLKIPYDEVAKSIALLGQYGVKAGPAGTALKYFWQNAVPKSKVALDVMQQYGLLTFNVDAATKKLGVSANTSYDAIIAKLYKLAGGQNTLAEATDKQKSAFDKWLAANGYIQSAFFDKDGNFKGTPQAIAKLFQAFEGKPKDVMMKAIRDMFGLRAGTASAQTFLGVIDQIWEESAKTGRPVADLFAEITDHMKKIDPAADIAAARMKDVAGRIEYVKGSWETFMNAVGEPFQAIVLKAVNMVALLVDHLGALARSSPMMAQTFAILIAGGVALTGFLGVVATLGATLPFVTAGLAGMGAAMLPLGLIMLTLGGLALAVVQAFRHPNSGLIPAVRDFVTVLQGASGYGIGAFRAAIMGLLVPAATFLGNLLSRQVIPFLTHLVAVLAVNAPGAVTALGNVFRNIFLPVLGAVTSGLFKLLNIGVDFLGWLLRATGPIGQAFQQAFGILQPIFNSYVKPAFDWLVNVIQTAIIPNVQLVVAWLAQHLPEAARQVGVALNNLRPVFLVVAGVLNTVVNVVKTAIPLILFLADHALKEFNLVGLAVYAVATAMGIAMTNWAAKTVLAAARAIAAWVLARITAVREFATMAVAAAVSAAQHTLAFGKLAADMLLTGGRMVWLGTLWSLQTGKMVASTVWMALQSAAAFVLMNGGLLGAAQALLAMGAAAAWSAIKVGLSTAAATAAWLADVAWASAQMLLNIALSAFDIIVGLLDVELLPIIAVILAVVAVVGLLYLAWQNNFLGIQDIAKSVGQAVVSIWTGVVDFVKGVWQFLTEAWASITGQSSDAAKAAMDGFNAQMDAGQKEAVKNTALNFTSIEDLMKQLGLDAGIFGTADGQNFMNGLNNGIAAGMPGLAGQLQSIEDALQAVNLDMDDVMGQGQYFKGNAAERKAARGVTKFRFAGLKAQAQRSIDILQGNTGIDFSQYNSSDTGPSDGQIPMPNGLGGGGIPVDTTGTGSGKGGSAAGQTKTAAETAADLATKVADAITKGIDALRKLSGVSIPANITQKSREFANAVALIMADMQKVSMQFASKDEALLTHVSAFVDAAAKAMDLIGKGIDALTKLPKFKAPTQAAVQSFVALIGDITRQFAGIAMKMSVDTIAQTGLFADTAGKVVDTVGKGVDGFNKLDDLVAPAQSSIERFVDAVNRLMQAFAPLGTTLAPELQDQASSFADATGKVMDGLSKAVDLFAKLNTLDVDMATAERRGHDIVARSLAIMQDLAHLVEGDPAWNESGEATVTGYGDAVGKVMDGLSKAADLLTKLSDPHFQLRDVSAATHTLVQTSAQIAQDLQATALAWSHRQLDAVSGFADMAGKVVDSLTKAADLLSKLSDPAFVIGDSRDELALIAQQLTAMAESLTTVGSSWSPRLVSDVGGFADTAGKVVDSLSKTLDLLSKLDSSGRSDYAQAGVKAQRIAETLAEVMTHVHLVVGDNFATGDSDKFATAAGTVVDALSKGLDLLTKLGEEVKQADANQVDQLSARIIDLYYGYVRALIMSGVQMNQATVYAAKLTADFTTSISTVIGGLGAGLDLLTKLADSGSVFRRNPERFLDPLFQMVKAIMLRARDLEAELRGVVTTEVVNVATMIGQAVGGLGAALDTFAKLSSFTPVANSRIDSFIENLRRVISRFDVLRSTIAPEMVKSTQEFFTALGPAFDVLGKALDLFKGITGTEDEKGKRSGGLLTVDPKAIGHLVHSLYELLGYIKSELIDQFAPDFAEVAGEFATKMGPAIDVMKGALDIFKGIAGDGKEDKGLKGGLKDAIGELVGDLYILLHHWNNVITGGEFQGDFQEKSTRFADTVRNVVGTIKDVFDLVQGINGGGSGTSGGGGGNKLGRGGRGGGGNQGGAVGAIAGLVTFIQQLGAAMLTAANTQLPDVTKGFLGFFQQVSALFADQVQGGGENNIMHYWSEKGFGLLWRMWFAVEGKGAFRWVVYYAFKAALTSYGELFGGAIDQILPGWQAAMSALVASAQSAMSQIASILSTAMSGTYTVTAGVTGGPGGTNPANGAGAGSGNNGAPAGASAASTGNAMGAHTQQTTNSATTVYNVRTMTYAPQTDTMRANKRAAAIADIP